jgi:dihydropteroate synthase
VGASLPENAKLYLTPSGLTFGREPSLSLPLAGGILNFNSLKVTLRGGNRVFYQGIFPVTSLKALKQQLPASLHAKFDATFKRLTAPRKSLDLPSGGTLSFAEPLVMGVLNLTPDSFSDGGVYMNPGRAAERARVLFGEGADIVDIGGESTRPGAKEVPPEEEIQRLAPVFDIVRDLPGPVSVDTRKAAVMAAALKAGVGLINDISALTFDLGALNAVKSAPGIVLMHALGTPETMQDNPNYDDVLLDVYDYLEERIEACARAGIDRERLIIDPGIGFGKTTRHILDLLKNLSLFHGLGVPVLVGVSRKRFIGELTGVKDPKERLSGSIAAAVLAAGQGAQIIRCHDVAETAQALAVFSAVGGKQTNHSH